MKSYWLVAGAAMLGMACVVTARPAGAVACGDVLTGPGAFRLDQDLVCSTTTALVVRDGATLDLGGHTVTCADLDNGIAVTGSRARLMNGTVTGCNDGVSLSGERHVVKGVHAKFNVRGFLAEDGLDDSRVSDSSAEFNGAGGFIVFGNGNLLRRNEAFGNADVAIFVVGNDNTLTRNATNGNCIVGGCAAAYEIGGNDNTLTRNTATGEATGFLITSGFGETSANTLTRNKALFSFLAGIVVQDGATGNTLVRNTASGAGTHLVDFNEDCDANQWHRNTFDTANQSCIE